MAKGRSCDYEIRVMTASVVLPAAVSPSAAPARDAAAHASLACTGTPLRPKVAGRPPVHAFTPGAQNTRFQSWGPVIQRGELVGGQWFEGWCGSKLSGLRVGWAQMTSCTHVQDVDEVVRKRHMAEGYCHEHTSEGNSWLFVITCKFGRRSAAWLGRMLR